jgi:Phosphate-selective porin O and P
MNLKSWIMPLALVVCTSAFADDAKITNAAIEQAAAEVADDAQVPEQNPDEVKPTTPTAEELAARLEGLGEAMTEARNSLEALNRLRVSGYILAQYVNDESSINELSGAAATRNKDQFSVREARVKFTYQFSPTSRFVLQPEVASSGVSLKDGFVEFTEPWSTWHHTLTAGQFNWPFGFEIAYSSSLRELPERSRVIRTLRARPRHSAFRSWVCGAIQVRGRLRQRNRNLADVRLQQEEGFHRSRPIRLGSSRSRRIPLSRRGTGGHQHECERHRVLEESNRSRFSMDYTDSGIGHSRRIHRRNAATGAGLGTHGIA